tara:strand:+ start:1621 stop:2412 length:792 start_codon:yes stop_codon:yes gene_type:complete
MKILKRVIYVFFIIVFVFYGVLIGKYEIFPYYYLKNFQDKFDTLIYNNSSDIKYTKNNNETFEYNLETNYLPLSNKYLINKININENIKKITKFTSNKTAFIIMDPWPTGEKEESIIENKIIPLVNEVLKKNQMVLIVTVNPRINKNPKNRVHEKLKKISDKNLVFIFHENHNKETFSEFLKSNNISSLIYLGFASNACIINRELGIINMKLQGFKTFFIPEASAAIEDSDSNIFHNKASMMIKRYWGEEIEYSHIMKKIRSL